jgi:hypothetical protein
MPKLAAPAPKTKEDLGEKVRAHIRYKTSTGDQVPGVTTVIGVLDKPALVGWANRLGLQGIDSNKYRDESASIGTLAHYLIVCELAEQEPDLNNFTPEQVRRAEWSLKSFHNWRQRHTLEPVLVEKALVSDEHRFGGMVDFFGIVDGKPTLLDFKTSKAIYAEHKIQVSAYTKLLITHGHKPHEVRVLQIGRTEDEGFGEHVLPRSQIATGWEIFQACLVVHRLMPKMKAGG